MRADTLVVMATNRGPAIAGDQLAAVRWACAGRFLAVVVDDRGDCAALAGPDCVVIGSAVPRRKELSGFKNQEGIAHALRRGVDFRAALCLDDDALPIGRGLDRFGLDRTGPGRAGLLGVADRVSYADRWPAMEGLFAEWAPEAAGFLPHPETLFYPGVWMARDLCDEMQARGLLVPPGCDRWPLWPDVYISWTAELLGFSVERVGTMDAPEAPYYCNHRGTMLHAPQPWLLRDDFLLYHSISAVPHFGEGAARARCALART